jgi:hypothetical protein
MKKSKFLLLPIILIPLIAFADPLQDARQSGLDFGSKYKSSAGSVITSENKTAVPGYKTDSPDETKYYDGTSTDADAQAKIKSSQQGDLMTNGLANRPKMTVKPSDDFLKTSQAIAGNPDEVVAMMTGTYGECKPLTRTTTETEVRTCDQYSEPDCVDGARNVTVLPSEGTTWSYPMLNQDISWRGGSGCSKYFVNTTINILDVSDIQSFVLRSVSWDDVVRVRVNGNTVFQNGDVDAGSCERGTIFGSSPNVELKSYLQNGANTIELKLGVSGMGFAGVSYGLYYPIDKVCRQYDNCVNIPQNCTYQNSRCLAFSDITNLCSYTQKVYACDTVTTTSTAQLQCGSNIYCTNNQCTTVEDNSQNDFATSIAYLQALNQAGKDNNNSVDNLKIFSGGANSCDIKILNYNNCCTDDGWGQNIGASCKENEQQLAQQKSKRLCHYVGSYCSKKTPLIGTCETTTKSYCCFTSKISRVINEQGRAQLGIGWGSGESPDCRGLTPDEMRRLHFNQMDLSEISADVANSVVVPDKTVLEGKVKQTLEGYAPNPSN